MWKVTRTRESESGLPPHSFPGSRGSSALKWPDSCASQSPDLWLHHCICDARMTGTDQRERHFRGYCWLIKSYPALGSSPHHCSTGGGLYTELLKLCLEADATPNSAAMCCLNLLECMSCMGPTSAPSALPWDQDSGNPPEHETKLQGL